MAKQAKPEKSEELGQAAHSARTLLDKLGAAGNSRYVYTCMVKPGDDDQTLMVAAAGDCSRWVPISTRHIDDIELVHSIQCGGHTHPLVNIFMKDPDSSEAKAFAGLAMLHHGSMRLATASNAARPTPGGVVFNAAVAPHPALPPGTTPCYWDWALQRWVCP